MNKIERHQSAYVERILFDLTEQEFKDYRLEQILGITNTSSRLFMTGSQNGAYVSVLFDITDDVPEKMNLNIQTDSLAMNHLRLMAHKLNEVAKDDYRLTAIGEPKFFESDTYSSATRHIEELDLFVDTSLIKHIVDHPKFVDIVFSATSRGIEFHGSTVRFSSPDRSIQYHPSILRRGYYKEVTEAFELDSKINVHVSLIQDIETEEVINQVELADYSLIRESSDEFLITLNQRAADILYRDPRVKAMIDYEYHHSLELSRGRWLPTPLSEIRAATEEEIVQITFKNRADLYNQPTIVIESRGQLKEFFDLLNATGIQRFDKTVIENQEVDFSIKNLVLYSQNEWTSSTSVRPRLPQWVDDELVIAVDRFSGGMLTASLGDQAQYFFAYIVDKTIPYMIFRTNKEELMINNVASDFDEAREKAMLRKRRFEENSPF